MSAQWTNEIVGKMHGKIKQSELAQKIGFHEKYVSAVLNGRRKPKGAEERFRQAVNELLAEKENILSKEGGKKGD